MALHSLMMFEALIINDGSTDRTSEIGHQYEASRPESFRVIDKENGHYGSCVNRGLSEARGVFIKILDADDSLELWDFAKGVTEDMALRAVWKRNGYFTVVYDASMYELNQDGTIDTKPGDVSQLNPDRIKPVSYTHLTLPTICSV